jgi:hypothetical protein
LVEDGSGVRVLVGAGGVLVGQEVIDGTRVLVGNGVLVGVRVTEGVKVGSGVQVGGGVLLGRGVLLGGGSGLGVTVWVGVLVGVQVTTLLGTAFRTSVQPLSNWARIPKSELWTPVSGPPPAQSLSKSVSQR